MGIQENKNFIRHYVDVVWNGHDLEKAREYLGGNETVDHVEQFLTAFPDVHVIIDDMIAEDDKVMVRIHANATNTGPFGEKPPTGKKVVIHSIRIFRIAENKIVETWAMQDRLGLMEQLGLVQSAGGKVNWAAGDEEE
ncbi:MAG TPA: ester cyclase [Anaerolineales bacterium]|nr:ester cyclase [Anaerolineales bacterium]